MSPHSGSNYAFMLCWSLAGAIIGYLYVTLLIGGLTFPQRERVPETWDELIASNYTVGVAKGTSMSSILEVLFFLYLTLV